MENRGIIKDIKNNTLFIELFKTSACASCSKCSMMDKTKNDLYKYKMIDKIDANIGDLITFEISNKFVFKLALLMYISPVLLMIISYIITSKLGISDGYSIAISFATLILSFFGFYIYDKKMGSKIVQEQLMVKSIKKQ